MENKLKNDQIISLHHIKHNPLKADPNAIIICYNTRRFTSFNDQFSTKDDGIKTKILQELNHLFYSPLEIQYALQTSQILNTIFNYLVDENKNIKIRILASIVIEQVTSEKIGQDTVIKNNKFLNLLTLLESSNVEIKINAFKSINNFSFWKSHKTLLLKNAVLNTIFENLIEKNSDKIVQQACLILKNLLEEGGVAQTCLSFNCAEKLIVIANQYSSEIIVNALDCLIIFSQCQKTKIYMVDADIHEELASIFFAHKSDFEIIERIFLVMTNLAQIVKAKKYFVDSGFVSIVLGYLQQYDPKANVILNSILFLTTLAEHQIARSELRKEIDKIQPFCSELFFPDACEYAVVLIEVISWNP